MVSSYLEYRWCVACLVRCLEDGRTTGRNMLVNILWTKNLS